MSMVINLVEDHNIYLCEGGPVYNGGAPTPPPITYLTQWKIVGNSEVHTDPYLTSWKVSGNSIVSNNTIMSCGDLGQDGKYHVKISNGVTIFDIPLTEPLRKYDNDNIDTIEFANGVAVVTRKVASYNLSNVTNWTRWGTSVGKRLVSSAVVITDGVLPQYNANVAKCLCASYETASWNNQNNSVKSIAISNIGQVGIYNPDYAEDETIDTYIAHIQGIEILYLLSAPTTELIDVSPFAVSPTDTYTSANVVPYSAFEHTENKEIWSCGEYNPTDGKWHILVQPQGGSIADIALTEPLRKVNDVADTIEFPSSVDGKALVTRAFGRVDLGRDMLWNFSSSSNRLYSVTNIGCKYASTTLAANMLCSIYNTVSNDDTLNGIVGIATQSTGTGAICVYDDNYNTSASKNDFVAHLQGVELVFELATPTTELVNVPQIEEADSYSMVISQGAKAVEWSSFETE